MKVFVLIYAEYTNKKILLFYAILFYFISFNVSEEEDRQIEMDIILEKDLTGKFSEFWKRPKGKQDWKSDW